MHVYVYMYDKWMSCVLSAVELSVLRKMIRTEFMKFICLVYFFSSLYILFLQNN